MNYGMIFPGYGSQHVGMIKDIYDHSRCVQEYFEEASNCLATNVVKLAFATSESELSHTGNAYLVQCITSVATASYLKERSLVPQVVAGFNNGIYAALCAAGGISFPDCLYLLNKCALLYQELLERDCYQIIKISGLPFERYKKFADERNLFCAALVHPMEFYISGLANDIDDFSAFASRIDRVTISSIPVEFGLHSVQAEPMQRVFNTYLEKVDFKDLAIPCINPYTGLKITTASQVQEVISQSWNTQMRWDLIMEALADSAELIAITPSAELSSFITDSFPHKPVHTIAKMTDIENLDASSKLGTV